MCLKKRVLSSPQKPFAILLTYAQIGNHTRKHRVKQIGILSEKFDSYIAEAKAGSVRPYQRTKSVSQKTITVARAGSARHCCYCTTTVIASCRLPNRFEFEWSGPEPSQWRMGSCKTTTVMTSKNTQPPL